MKNRRKLVTFKCWANCAGRPHILFFSYNSTLLNHLCSKIAAEGRNVAVFNKLLK